MTKDSKETELNKLEERLYQRIIQSEKNNELIIAEKINSIQTKKELIETKSLLNIAENRISSQMTFISVFLTIAGLVTAALVVKQYFASEELNRIKNNIDAHINEKLDIVLKKERGKRITTSIHSYINREDYLNDNKATNFNIITDGWKLSDNDYRIIAEGIQNLLNYTGIKNNTDGSYTKLSGLTYIASRSKPNQIIDYILQTILISDTSQNSGHSLPHPQSIYMSIMEYYIQDVNKYESQIIKLIELEREDVHSNIHVSYLLIDKYDSTKVSKSIADLFRYKPYRLINFSNDKGSIDEFFKGKWQEVISEEGLILQSNTKVNQRIDWKNNSKPRFNENSYLAKKLNELKN